MQLAEEKQENEGAPFSTKRQIAHLIFQHCKISDIQGQALEVNDILNIELRNEETCMALEIQTDETFLEGIFDRLLLKSPLMKPLGVTYVRTENFQGTRDFF